VQPPQQVLRAHADPAGHCVLAVHETPQVELLKQAVVLSIVEPQKQVVPVVPLQP
jgi:hypothetical protein